MSRVTDFLMAVQGMAKMQDSVIKEVCTQFDLTLTEGKVLTFLFNNPEKDTAGDIVELRNLSKGNVSIAVEGLIKKHLLERTQDQKDRRKIHLSLLPATKPITDLIENRQNYYGEELFSGFSEEERILYMDMHRRMTENAKKAIKRSRRDE